MYRYFGPSYWATVTACHLLFLFYPCHIRLADGMWAFSIPVWERPLHPVRVAVWRGRRLLRWEWREHVWWVTLYTCIIKINKLNKGGVGHHLTFFPLIFKQDPLNTSNVYKQLETTLCFQPLMNKAAWALMLWLIPEMRLARKAGLVVKICTIVAKQVIYIVFC